MSSIAVNLAAIRARIDSACKRVSRDPRGVTLVAVTKLQPPELIRQAFAAGQRDFGENYAQELRDKAVELANLAGIRWHAIGPLQVNKAKYVAERASAFHALDRVEVARELSRRRQGQPLRCYLEINVAGEATKSGVPPDDAPALLEAVRSASILEVVGLMTVPPAVGDPEASRPYFRQLRALADKLGLPELSMGMTGDFEIAIEEGATCVRVGTAIFGQRPVRVP